MDFLTGLGPDLSVNSWSLALVDDKLVWLGICFFIIFFPLPSGCVASLQIDCFLIFPQFPIFPLSPYLRCKLEGYLDIRGKKR